MNLQLQMPYCFSDVSPMDKDSSADRIFSMDQVSSMDQISSIDHCASEGASSSRFSRVSEEELMRYEDTCQAKSTKINTKWAVRLFQGKIKL